MLSINTARKGITALAVVLVFNLITPALLFASTDAHKLDWEGFFYRALVFVIFLALLIFLLRKPIKKLLTGRTEEIYNAMTHAMRAKVDAEHLMKEYESKSAELLKELEIMKKEAEALAEAEAKLMIAEAHQHIEKMKAQAKQHIENEMAKAKNDLRKEITLLALDEAEKRITKDVKSAKGSKIMNQYIKRIGA